MAKRAALPDWLSQTASPSITRRPRTRSWTANIHRPFFCPAQHDGERRAAQLVYVWTPASTSASAHEVGHSHTYPILNAGNYPSAHEIPGFSREPHT